MRMAKYFFVMLAKMTSFSQLPAVKRHYFNERDKQIFGPSYFVATLIKLLCNPKIHYCPIYCTYLRLNPREYFQMHESYDKLYVLQSFSQYNHRANLFWCRTVSKKASWKKICLLHWFLEFRLYTMDHQLCHFERLLAQIFFYFGWNLKKRCQITALFWWIWCSALIWHLFWRFESK